MSGEKDVSKDVTHNTGSMWRRIAETFIGQQIKVTFETRTGPTELRCTLRYTTDRLVVLRPDAGGDDLRVDYYELRSIELL